MTNQDEKLLVMDGDPTVAKSLSSHFTELGYQVAKEAGLPELLASRASDWPDIIIADLTPTEMESLRAAFADAPQAPPVIVHTTIPDTPRLLEFLRGGAADVVPKPLADVRLLDEAVQRQQEKVSLYRENLRYRRELEQANRELKAGLEELKADQRAGRHVQVKMLPENQITLNGLSCHYVIQPSLYLSGDFFDYFSLGDQRTVIFFADVSGHGASSAFVTVLLKNLSNRLRRNYYRKSSDDLSNPANFIQRINTELLETRIGKHLTLFVAIFDTEKRTLTYSVGAHYPMPILTQGGVSEYLEGKGPPVGLLPNAKYPVYERALERGFSLVTCSDGLLEVIQAPSLEEKERALLETVKQAGHTIPELEKAFGLRRAPELPDDVAIVSIAEEQVANG